MDAVREIEAIAAVPVILDVVCRTTGMGFAAIARVTADRWIACRVLDTIDFGLAPGEELKIETTLCHEVRQSRDVIVIDHVAEDSVYCRHPIPATYGFQSYVSVPIILPDGTFFGTLCAIDPRPARLNRPEVLGMFKLFAELIAYHLDAGRKLADSEARLLGEREVARQRDEFIAVLGHDLRNPLASLGAGARMLSKRPLEKEAADIVRLMQNSIDRMDELIRNVLDSARGRLGGGLPLERETKPIEPAITQVLNEARSASPDRVFKARLQLALPVDCDHGKIARLLANLLDNALVHGAPEAPIGVAASTSADAFELAVTNAGDPIPLAVREQLFRPFYRRLAHPSQRGLGLGLHIASEIAKAHGGTLSVTSSPKQTRFTLRMPRQAAQDRPGGLPDSSSLPVSVE